MVGIVSRWEEEGGGGRRREEKRRLSYFQIAMDDRWRPRVKKVEAFEDLTAPRLQHLQIDLLEPPQVPGHKLNQSI